jgi:hypothetical protein
MTAFTKYAKIPPPSGLIPLKELNPFPNSDFPETHISTNA